MRRLLMLRIIRKSSTLDRGAMLICGRYFNLAGKPTIEGTKVTLCTDAYLPVDEFGIPTGGPTAYSKITASEPFVLGPEEPDVDDCFVVNESLETLDTRSSELNSLVKAYHPDTKIHLEVLSTEPAFQFYTGKYISVPKVEGAEARGPRSGFCVEPSRFVNAINVPEWKGQVVLKKGEVYGSRIVYRGWSDE
jgi:aldose 1-epimerase